jgi:hypothetical protein
MCETLSLKQVTMVHSSVEGKLALNSLTLRCLYVRGVCPACVLVLKCAKSYL